MWSIEIIKVFPFVCIQQKVDTKKRVYFFYFKQIKIVITCLISNHKKKEKFINEVL